MEITAYTAPVCVRLVQLLLGRGEEPPTLLPLQAPHLLAQPYLHVYLGSPCGICWGGGGKTMVSFPHRLSKPGAISLGLAEESSTFLKLFNPCSAKPLCVPRTMRALVCREEIFRSTVIPRFLNVPQEGWVILKILCLKTESQHSSYCTLKIIFTKAIKTLRKYHKTNCHLKVVLLPIYYLAFDKLKWCLKVLWRTWHRDQCVAGAMRKKLATHPLLSRGCSSSSGAALVRMASMGSLRKGSLLQP